MEFEGAKEIAPLEFEIWTTGLSLKRSRTLLRAPVFRIIMKNQDFNVRRNGDEA